MTIFEVKWNWPTRKWRVQSQGLRGSIIILILKKEVNRIPTICQETVLFFTWRLIFDLLNVWLTVVWYLHTRNLTPSVGSSGMTVFLEALVNANLWNKLGKKLELKLYLHFLLLFIHKELFQIRGCTFLESLKTSYRKWQALKISKFPEKSFFRAYFMLKRRLLSSKIFS